MNRKISDILRCWFMRLAHSWDKDPLDTLTYGSLWRRKNHYESLTIRVTEKNTETENVKSTDAKRSLVSKLQIHSRRADCNHLLISLLLYVCEIILIKTGGIEFSKLNIIWGTALEYHKLDFSLLPYISYYGWFPICHKFIKALDFSFLLFNVGW